MNNIVLCGFMGSGKTVVGKELAKILGVKFVDTDELIEEEQGVAIKAIFAAHGEDYFRDLEYEMCKKVAEMNGVVVSTGGGAMTFKRNVDAIKEGSKVVFLDASFDVICERIGDSTTRPLFQDKEKAKKLYDERKDKYLSAADYVINGDMGARKTAMQIAEIFR
ncbi:shikimate kinase [uncultured Eubacterium sp.]|uniref:shikimate kinase n=1 Tax=uncultured Eubacterium sp. TaxID=165185 RepID=UPI0025F71F77|nr:shikimate kinase [uncultured Eubacterium sp.]MDO4363160.1 shikimate kinase [Clostridia bacterium]